MEDVVGFRSHNAMFRPTGWGTAGSGVAKRSCDPDHGSPWIRGGGLVRPGRGGSSIWDVAGVDSVVAYPTRSAFSIGDSKVAEASAAKRGVELGPGGTVAVDLEEKVEAAFLDNFYEGQLEWDPSMNLMNSTAFNIPLFAPHVQFFEIHCLNNALLAESASTEQVTD